MTSNTDTDDSYINTTEYDKLSVKFKKLVDSMDEEATTNKIARDLRYVEVDIEGERSRGKLLPDELLIPQHIIDTNIRREQASYVQYITQSPRAVILQDQVDPAMDTSVLEKDVTAKLRFEGWQLSMFPCIDGMQQNGYSVMEIVYDETQPGDLAHEFVEKGDFGKPSDTKDIQEAEMIARNYYFSKTRLKTMASDPTWGFDPIQVENVISQQPDAKDSNVTAVRDKSLYRIQKVMFRVDGVVNVAWACDKFASDWLRKPRLLYIGRRKLREQPSILDLIKSKLQGIPPSDPVFETKYPYVIFPYLISENATISQLHGRAFLDQDVQQAVMSIVSSYCTGLRRSSGAYFSKNTEDPNDDLLMQKNIFFRSGALINSKITSFSLPPPPSDCIGAITMLVSANQNETSQVNFAEKNTKDSRKTATAVNASMQMAQQLSTVQVVLFSNSTSELYGTMFEIIKSRVITGVMQKKINPAVAPLYNRSYTVKASGDVDVIERQQIISMMLQAWPVVQNTPAAIAFLSDLLSKMFPDSAPKYLKIFQEAQAAQQSQQAQQMQQLTSAAQAMGNAIVQLSKSPEMFSDIGKIHSLPALKIAAQQIEATQKAVQQPNTMTA